MTDIERDELFRLVMRYYDGECSGEEAEQVRALLEKDDQARLWMADMEAMGDATFEFVRAAVDREDFTEYWVTVDEGVRSPTAALREKKRQTEQLGLMAWLQRHLGDWLVPAGGLALAGAAALIVVAVGLPWAMKSDSMVTVADWEGIASVDNTLEIEEIEGDQWSVSIVAAGKDQPMIIWLDDMAGKGDQG